MNQYKLIRSYVKAKSSSDLDRDLTLQDSINPHLFLGSCLGLGVFSKSNKRTIFYSLYSYFCLIIYTSFSIALTIFFCFYPKTLNVAALALYIITIQNLIKYLYCYKNWNGMIDNFKSLKAKYFLPKTTAEMEVLFRRNKFCLIYYSFYVFFVWNCYFFEMIFVFIFKVQLLFINSETFVDRLPYLPHMLAWLWTLLGLLMAGATVAMSDSLTIAYMLHIVVNFELLKLKLIKLQTSPIKNMEEVKDILKDCMEYHNRILEYAKAIYPFLSCTCLVQLLISNIVLGATIARVMQDPSVEVFASAGELFIGVLVQNTVYCYFGDWVTQENRSIANSLWNTKWLEYSAEVRRMLIPFIAITQHRPIYISAGGFINASLGTLLTIYRTALSYSTFMYQIHTQQT